jgi:KaiC/GvpD/RAD55 family RecA-like ATPase
LASTGVQSLDAILGGDGYPDRSTVLIVGPPGIGKESLGYWFTSSGLIQNDFCLYNTRLSSKEVLQDAKAFNIDFSQRVPLWFSSSGGQMKFEVNDLSGLSYNIKDLLKKNSDRRIRVVADVLSSLLMLNQPEAIYKFLTQLFADIKQYECVFLATVEEGMHPPNVLAAMQQLFDGVIELRLYEEGLRVVPLLRIRKMRGIPPQPGYFNFSFSKTGMEITNFVK